MAKDYRSAGLDFDDQFDPDIVGDGPTAPQYKVNGTPLKYADIKYGSKGPNCGYAENNVDLSNKWAAKGTARYALPIDGESFIAHSSGLNSPAMEANIQVDIKSNGTYSVTCIGNGFVSGNASGTWLPAGRSVSEYQVEFVWQQSSQYTSGPATVTNGAATYQSATTTRTVSFDAQVGQFTGLDKGSSGTLIINLKRVSTGVVTVTRCGIDVESAGTG